MKQIEVTVSNLTKEQISILQNPPCFRNQLNMKPGDSLTIYFRNLFNEVPTVEQLRQLKDVFETASEEEKNSFFLLASAVLDSIRSLEHSYENVRGLCIFLLEEPRYASLLEEIKHLKWGE